MSQKDDFFLYHECHDYLGGKKPGSSRMGNNYTSCTLCPLNFILMIAVEWEAKSLNKEIYNKLGQVWWGKCSCGTNISINQFKSTGEFLRDSFAGHKCWPYVVSMYRNLHESNITKYWLELRNSFIYRDLTPEVFFYLNVWGTGIRDSLGLAMVWLWTLNWSTQPGRLTFPNSLQVLKGGYRNILGPFPKNCLTTACPLLTVEISMRQRGY